MAKIKNIVKEDAKIIFRNFRGEATKFSPAGRRTFCVVLSEEEAEDYRCEGWNVKSLPPRSEDEDPLYYLQVKVNFGSNPPKVYLCTSKKKTLLDEDTVGQIDHAEICNVDLVITPYNYEVNGKAGISAYLKNMYVTVVEDEFADKYEYDE